MNPRVKAQVHELIVNAGSNTILKTVRSSKDAEVLSEVRDVPCGVQIVLMSNKPFVVKLREGSFRRTLHSSAS